GVNRFQVEIESGQEAGFEVREVDNEQVRSEQLQRLKAVKDNRDAEKVRYALTSLEKAAETGESNLLELAATAARERATLGEISQALEKIFGRFQATSRTIQGVYAKEIAMNEDYIKARQLSDHFAEMDGRRPRILVAKMGQDGHDRGAKVIATSFADLGFDVDIGPLFQTPEEVARQAGENDVHVIGISSLAGAHKSLVPDLIEELKKIDRDDVGIIVGGVIPPRDYDFLYQLGVLGVFGPGTVIAKAAQDILKKLIGEAT
ncbi:MAG: methylmalonyl-CoA mutase family protein, partial [Bacteroidota bacterium]